MASKKISELSSTSEFSDDAYIPVVSDGVTYKMTLESLLQKTLRLDKTLEVSDVASKTTISNADVMMMEDASSSNDKKRCTKAQFLHDVPQVETGSSAPASTPSKKGMLFVDTAAGDIYIAAGTSSSSDWKKVS